VCSPIIQRCLEGYNGTIFAYGQTSSGKTHSMLGTSFDKGILLQSVSEIFEYISENQDNRDVTLWASYLEVYNEQINDLLDVTNVNLKLREDPVEGYYASGLKSIKIHQVEDFRKLLALGEKSRRYRATDMNEHSSRSHTIFRILIENRLCQSKRVVLENQFKKKETEEVDFLDEIGQKHLSYGTKYSVLNLVDLAGSERLAMSGHSSVDETGHINKSLFVLANVIYKLSESKKGN
jgi:centromeric protein E